MSSGVQGPEAVSSAAPPPFVPKDVINYPDSRPLQRSATQHYGRELFGGVDDVGSAGIKRSETWPNTGQGLAPAQRRTRREPSPEDSTPVRKMNTGQRGSHRRQMPRRNSGDPSQSSFGSASPGVGQWEGGEPQKRQPIAWHYRFGDCPTCPKTNEILVGDGPTGDHMCTTCHVRTHSSTWALLPWILENRADIGYSRRRRKRKPRGTRSEMEPLGTDKRSIETE